MEIIHRHPKGKTDPQLLQQLREIAQQAQQEAKP